MSTSLSEDYHTGHGIGYDAAVSDILEYIRETADEMYGLKEITSKQMLALTNLIRATEIAFEE